MRSATSSMSKGLLGNQNHISATGDAAVHGDPSCVASHDLYHHDALVRFGSSVEAVNGFHRCIDCGVEAETEVGSTQVVVNRLGNTHDFDASFEQLLRDTVGVVASDGDQSVQIIVLEGFHAALKTAFAL